MNRKEISWGRRRGGGGSSGRRSRRSLQASGQTHTSPGLWSAPGTSGHVYSAEGRPAVTHPPPSALPSSSLVKLISGAECSGVTRCNPTHRCYCLWRCFYCSCFTGPTLGRGSSPESAAFCHRRRPVGVSDGGNELGRDNARHHSCGTDTESHCDMCMARNHSGLVGGNNTE